MDDIVKYTFEYVQEGEPLPGYPINKGVVVSVDFSSDEPWTVVADEFFAFLSNIYGYPVTAEKYNKAKSFQTTRPFNFTEDYDD